MARRKAFPAEKWPEVLQALIDEAINRFGREPCLALEEDENGGSGAVIVASATRGQTVKKLFDGMGTFTNRKFDSFEISIYQKEIPAVLRLLMDYQQPEPDFDANLDYWSNWLPPELAIRFRDQADLLRWC